MPRRTIVPNPSGTAGPKVAHFERVEWHVMPEPSSAAAALQAGEVAIQFGSLDALNGLIERLRRS